MAIRKHTKLFFIMLVFFLFITGFRLIWITQLQPPIKDAGSSVSGKMDLSNKNNAIIQLVGDWKYYPNKLLKQSEIDELGITDRGEDKRYPADWLDISESKNYTYGTFHMRLTLDDRLPEQSLSLHVPNTRLASKLYVNGRELAASGNPSTKEDEFIGSMSPYTTSFIANGNAVDIILHVANNGLTPNVSTSPILFGTTEAINKQLYIAKISKISFIIILGLLISISIYLFFRLKNRKALLYFSLVLLGAILMVLFDYDQVLLLDLPLDYQIKSKILRLVYIMIALFLFLYFRSFLPNNNNSRWYKYYPYGNILYALFVIFAPLSNVLMFGSLLAIILIIPAIYFIHMLFNALKNNLENVELLLLGGIAILTNIVWGIIKNNVEGVIFHFYPIDLLLAVLLFILYWLEIHFRHIEENEVLKNQLIEKDKSKDEFLAITSHELRNPLHSMINIAQFVKDNPRNDIVPEDKKDMDLLLSVGKQMSFLIDDLLDLALINDKKIRLNKKELNLHSTIVVVMDMLGYLLESKKVVLRNDILEDFPKIQADEQRVIQIFLNLIHNAIKFTDEGEIVVSSEVKNDFASIQVRDTGKGMSEKVLQDIFNPYITNEQNNGIGLGLRVTKELIELHGGKISVTSTLHKGTTFTITMPLADHTEKAAQPNKINRKQARLDIPSAEPKTMDNPNPNPRQVMGMKLLLVDDDPVNLRVISNILATEGYDITTAGDGEEALQKIGHAQYDLVISDVMMPGMSGYELTRMIRKQYDLSELPIILLTARGRTEDLNVGLKAGANDYVIKPVEPLELKSRVRVLMDLQLAVKSQLKLEAAWLRAQINPHFLFNTINSIMNMSKSDPTRMEYVLNEFIYFLRTSFDFHNKEHLILLKDELDLVDAYLTIEKERFGERIQINWEIDESLDISIPPLSLQTLVENAVNHGILSRIGGGTITLRSIDELEYVDIIIKDDGVGMPEDIIQMLEQQNFRNDKGIGIINTDKRLRKWLGSKLIIESKENQGTKITIRVKKQ